MRTRLIACLALLCLAPLAQAQPAERPSGRPQSLEARMDALEKENATLRADVDRLQQQLTRTRNGLAVTSGLAAQAPFSVIQSPTLAQQQAQTDAIIRQQDTATQLNNLQLQQNMMMDRQREQQLFLPQPYGALPSTPGVTPMPN